MKPSAFVGTSLDNFTARPDIGSALLMFGRITRGTPLIRLATRTCPSERVQIEHAST